MMIDSHLHFGQIGEFNMPKEMLITSLAKYNIDIAIVSNIEGCEFDSELNLIPEKEQVAQLEVNRRTLKLVKTYPDKLRGQFWIKPYQEGFDSEVEEFILNNRKYFVGLKVHPYHSNLALTEQQCQPYLEFANQHQLSVAVHTADDEKSRPYHVYQMAQKYNQIDFIMVHLGLGTDNSQAIKYVAQQENLYGDTTWVSYAHVKKKKKKCGADKILFGTDSPIDGVDTYQKYEQFLEAEKNAWPPEVQKQVFSTNAKKVFNLTE